MGSRSPRLVFHNFHPQRQVDPGVSDPVSWEQDCEGHLYSLLTPWPQRLEVPRTILLCGANCPKRPPRFEGKTEGSSTVRSLRPQSPGWSPGTQPAAGERQGSISPGPAVALKTPSDRTGEAYGRCLPRTSVGVWPPHKPSLRGPELTLQVSGRLLPEGRTLPWSFARPGAEITRPAWAPFL